MRVLFLFCFSAVAAWAADTFIAPDIERGMTPEAVVQLYGWPKGKSVSGERENWAYDRFQVLFETGRVVSVKPWTETAPKNGARVPFQAARPIPSSNRTPPASMAPQQTYRVIGAPSQRPPQTVAPSPVASRPEIAPKPPVRQTKANEAQGLLHAWFMPIFGIAAVAVGIAGGALWLRRKKVPSLDSILFDGGATPAKEAKPKTWQDSVAERLTRQHGTTAAPAGEPPPLHEVVPKPVPQDLTQVLLFELDWKRFELLVARYFEATGIRSELTSIGADGGVDVRLYRTGEERPFSLVQCKAYGPGRFAKVEQVRALKGVMAEENVSQGVFVTTGQFGAPAIDFAAKANIELIDNAEFMRRFASLASDDRKRIVREVTEGDYTTPTCALHDVKLVRRVNGKDGSEFWACPKYGCRSGWNVRSSE